MSSRTVLELTAAEARRPALEDAVRAVEAVAAYLGATNSAGLSEREVAVICGRIDGARMAADAIRRLMAG